MEGPDLILDQNLNPTDNRKYVEQHLAGGWRRFANHLIDTVMFYLLAILGMVVIGLLGGEQTWAVLEEESTTSDLIWTLGGLGFLIMYYLVMEAALGRTVGKFITKTKVVTVDGQQPTPLNIMGRTLCRLIPFDALSFLASDAVGWHDSISNTRVIKT